MLGKEPKTVPTLGRTPEEAQELFKQATLTFSKGGARSRYIPRVLNRLLNIQKYEYGFLMEGLRTIPANEKQWENCNGVRTKNIASWKPYPHG